MTQSDGGRPYLLIVAAGGYATRAFPLTGYGAKSKTLVNVGVNGATVLEEIVREAASSGVADAVLVTSSETNHEAFARFFDPLGADPFLADYLRRRGRADERATLDARPTIARPHFVVQKEPRGFGDAIAHGRPQFEAGAADGTPFAGAVVALGDDIVHGRIPAMRQLISAHESAGTMIVAVQRVPREQAMRYGVVVVEPNSLDLGAKFLGRRAFRVVGMEEKPADPTPNRLGGEDVYFAVVGRYLINKDDLDFLSGHSGTIEKELDFTALLQRNARSGNLIAVELDGTWHSVGTPFEAQRAFLQYALTPESGEPTESQRALRAYVRELLGDSQE